MTTEQKKELIDSIIITLRYTAKNLGKPFDEGDVFFSLCFKSDEELLKIAKLSGC